MTAAPPERGATVWPETMTCPECGRSAALCEDWADDGTAMHFYGCMCGWMGGDDDDGDGDGHH